jgi:hypothetical protein
MVPPSSIWISRVPIYFSSASSLITFRLRGFHPLRLALPNHSTKSSMLLTSRLFPFRSPLLRKSLLISFPLGTEMFQFPRFASLPLSFQGRIIRSLLSGSPIQISPALRSLPTPRGFSQATTSFFASYRLGIHLVRFFLLTI